MTQQEAKKIIDHLSVTSKDDVFSAADKVGQLRQIIANIMSMNKSASIDEYYRGIK